MGRCDRTCQRSAYASDRAGRRGHERCAERAGLRTSCVVESNTRVGVDSAGYDFGLLQSADRIWSAAQERTAFFDLADRSIDLAFPDCGYRQPAAGCDSHSRAKSRKLGGVSEDAIVRVLAALFESG